MRHRRNDIAEGETLLVFVTPGRSGGRARPSLLRSVKDAERCLEELLSHGVSPAQLRAFRVRPLDLPPRADRARTV